VNSLKFKYQDVHGAYADSVRHLNHILNWPSARLLVLGNALAGNMIEAMEAWRVNENNSLTVNESVLIASGFGALHYRPGTDRQEDDLDRSYWIRATQGLINRTLIVWPNGPGYHDDSRRTVIGFIIAVPLTYFRHTGSRAAAIRYPRLHGCRR